MQKKMENEMDTGDTTYLGIMEKRKYICIYIYIILYSV